MIDLVMLGLATVAVAGGLGAGAIVGNLAGRNRARTPTCGCGHHLAVHDRGTRVCAQRIARERRGYERVITGIEYVACPCQGYIGAEPLTKVWLADTPLPPAVTEV